MNSAQTSSFHWSQRLSLLVAVALLCGAGVESRRFQAPPDATAYQAGVVREARRFPLKIGTWIGSDEKIEQEAVKLLRPNYMISRQYRNTANGQAVGLIFVDCQDARDTVGHYPPICYPNQGYTQETTQKTDWVLPSMTIHGTEYTFVKGVLDSSGNETVDDFFVMPGAGTAPDRTAVMQAAKDLQRRFYGVAQVQLVFPGDWTVDDRQQVFNELIGPMQDLIGTVEEIRPAKTGNGHFAGAADDAATGENHE